MFNRSRRNLARWFTLSMGSILVVFAAVVYYLKVEDELESLDRLLYKKTSVMAASARYKRYTTQSRIDLNNVPLLGNPRPIDSELVYARWYDPQRRLVQFFGEIPPEEMAVAFGFYTLKMTPNKNWLNRDALWLRQVTLPVYQNGLLIGYLQVAAPLTSTQAKLDELLLSFAIAVPVAVGFIGVTGWFLGGLAMQPIREAYDQLQRFTSNASHELRTPLAAILSNAQVGLLLNDASQQNLRLQKIVEAAKSMNSLVNNLLLLARYQGLLPADSLKNVDLVIFLQEIFDNSEGKFAKRNVELTSHFPEQPVKFQADPDLLRQAVINLLSNAMNYTPAGGTVELKLFTQSYQAVIQVKDTGIGIPPAELPHIFERFYRVETKRARETEGFGLGLAIVQQIVAAHGGKISVNSMVGKGSTFQIEFPLKLHR